MYESVKSVSVRSAPAKVVPESTAFLKIAPLKSEPSKLTLGEVRGEKFGLEVIRTIYFGEESIGEK